jgi:glycosyltransferase involved in cell wall biosynthesis
MFVLRKTGNDPAVIRFKLPKDNCSSARRFLRGKLIDIGMALYRNTRPDGYELFTNDKNRLGRQLLRQLPPADVINLHWISGFIDYASFFPAALRQSRIVWTLHDMNAFTGGCHYDMGCGRYLEGCGQCPQLGSERQNDLSRRIWKRKYRLFSSLDSSRVHLVALNRWMEAEVKRSPLLQKYPVSVIPNGVDLSVFRPRDRKAAREFLGVNQYEKVVLFIADSVVNRRKGFSLLAQALQGMGEMSRTVLLSVGRNPPEVPPGLPHIHLGHINNDHWLSQIYSAADIFVIPSVQDNLPNTVLESIACGTPVVGFNVGGIPDMVRNGVTGLLVEPGSTDELHRNIRALLENDGLRATMAEKCREFAIKEYSMEVQARNYVAVYEELLGTGRAAGASHEKVMGTGLSKHRD